MTSARRTPSAAKCALLAGVAVAFMVHAAHAAPRPARVTNTGLAPHAPHTTTAGPSDGLSDDELYMEADRVERDDKDGRTIAEGSVEIRYQGRTLRADRIVYDEGQDNKPGVIRAFGHAQIVNADGSVEFADQMTLDDQMSAGVAQGFAARLPKNAKLASSSLVRRSDQIQELNRAIYTPCTICAANGHAVTPTWSIQADRVVQDKRRRIIFYRNARIRVKGVPLLYLPVFWHADPTADRVSGLLTPVVGESRRRGFSYEQPYLWAATPSTDVIVSPQINTKVNPLLNTEIRQRFYSGEIDVRAGYTYERDIDGSGHAIPGSDKTSRSYILGRGAFQITDDWLLGFTAERTSDRLLFDKYDIGHVFIGRGPFVADDRRLISQVYAIRQDSENYFSAAAMSIQGLRGSVANPAILENNRTFPLIAPLIEDRYNPNTPVFGGRLQIVGSAVALTREQSPDNPALPGIDSRRATVEADWNRTFTSPGGVRLEPFANVRADAYSLSDVPNASGVGVRSFSTGRTLATVGANLSYPLYRRWRDATVVLEPLVQVAASPEAKQIVIGHDATGAPVYLDEDSAAFEFDETNLFSADKFPGYDLYEDGARLNVGGRGSVLWDDGRRASLLVGRSFRSERNDVFSPSSGLRGQASDWIVAGDAQPIKGLSFFARARLDSDTLEVHRLEAGVNAQVSWAAGYVRYLRDDAQTTTGIATLPGVTTGATENMDIGGELHAGKNWGLTLYGNRDFIQKAWVIRDVGVFYRDDCVRVDVIYRREDTVIGRLGGSDQITVRLTLATLGGR